MKNKIYEDNGFVQDTTEFPDNEYICTVSECLLSEPCFILSSTDKKYLYSTEQMIAMFKIGYDSHRRESHMRAPRKRRRTPMAPYRLLRSMSLGDNLLFPYEMWGAVRTAASRLHTDFGCVFRVTKTAPTGEKGDIEVTRIS